MVFFGGHRRGAGGAQRDLPDDLSAEAARVIGVPDDSLFPRPVLGVPD